MWNVSHVMTGVHIWGEVSAQICSLDGNGFSFFSYSSAFPVSAETSLVFIQSLV